MEGAPAEDKGERREACRRRFKLKAYRRTFYSLRGGPTVSDYRAAPRKFLSAGFIGSVSFQLTRLVCVSISPLRPN